MTIYLHLVPKIRMRGAELHPSSMMLWLVKY